MKNIERAKAFQRSLYQADGREWTDGDFSEDWIYKPFGADWDKWFKLGLAPVKFCALCGDENHEGGFITNRNSIHHVPIYLCASCAQKRGYPADSMIDVKSSEKSFDAIEFHASGTYLWGMIYPLLLGTFYLAVTVGWVLLGLKQWGIVLVIIYFLVGLCNFHFVTVPSSAVRSNKFPSMGEVLHSIVISPGFLLFYPLVNFFMIIRLTLMAMKSPKEKGSR